MSDAVSGSASDTPNDQQPSVEDFDQWVQTLPQERVKALAERVVGNYREALAEHYKDFMPIVERAERDPEYRQRLARLSDENFDRYLWETAMPVYERMNAAPKEEQRDPSSDLEKKISSLEEKISSSETERQRERYLSERAMEVQALIKEFPELSAYESDQRVGKRMARIIDLAEKNSVANQKRIPYRQVYEELREEFSPGELATAHFPTVPAVSAAEPPSPQAPRTVTERKNRTLQMLNKAGGFAAFARGGARR